MIKIICKIVFGLALITFFLPAQNILGQTNSQTATQTILSEADRASVEMVKLFNQNKFDEAFPLAQKALELNSKEFGAAHLKTANSYVNLGYVQRGRGKKKEAITAFENALSIYDKISDLDENSQVSLAQMLESLGYLKFDDGKEGGSEKYYRRALEIREKVNGAEAKETVNTLWSLGNLNASVADNEEAAALYRRVFEMRLKTLGASNADTSDAFRRCRCTLLKAGKNDQAKALEEQFEAITGPPQDNFAIGVRGGVVNGKAAKLEMPSYPQAAKSERAEGQVNVDVTINENGEVIYACGAGSQKIHSALIAAAERAAYKSKFTPTSLSGKPVKVNGVIVYNFVAR